MLKRIVFGAAVAGILLATPVPTALAGLLASADASGSPMPLGNGGGAGFGLLYASASATGSTSNFGPELTWFIPKDHSYATDTYGNPVGSQVTSVGYWDGNGNWQYYAPSNYPGPGMVGSSAQILDGTASADTTVRMAWRTRTYQLSENLFIASDIVNLTGIYEKSGGQSQGGRVETDMYVLQMSYNPDLVDEDENSSDHPSLGYLDPITGQWRESWEGNFWPGETPPSDFVWRAYGGVNDFVLGHGGIDTFNNVVWGVVNYEGQFGVVPEPSALIIWSLLGGFGISVGWWWRRNKAL